MRYVLIGTAGTYTVPGGIERWKTDLGTQSPTRVPLAPLPGTLGPITGWINAAATTMNDIGGEVLVVLGATGQDYHGPVVITGWDEAAETVRGLNSDQAAAIRQAYDDANA
ncbi:hypothetical protein C1I98_13330 [Spongiactinospora gelatinilytica]|uniref:Uncharacterized protein n=1 Tax=Spongiactinospora gelatinilytica TaxID=2666298 RepID=A0A2W2HCY2_9ACTN|nr:hypothetical protein [Spongiactinospora gelatinilytica]PZG47448.1 hypothetical protein C1I98_13330 [Spongiactinospora gelatinilytica]